VKCGAMSRGKTYEQSAADNERQENLFFANREHLAGLAGRIHGITDAPQHLPEKIDKSGRVSGKVPMRLNSPESGVEIYRGLPF